MKGQIVEARNLHGKWDWASKLVGLRTRPNTSQAIKENLARATRESHRA